MNSIEALTGEVERLTEELKADQETATTWFKERNQARSLVREYRRENERLTQALSDSNLALMEQTELADKCRKQAETLEAERDQARAAQASAPVAAAVQGDVAPVGVKPTHPDNEAVDRFAAAMKHKLAVSRDKGRGGWEDETRCCESDLAQMLVEHVAKGDPVDIANFAMMLHQREAVAVEHHPCNGGQAKRAIAAAAQPSAAQGEALVHGAAGIRPWQERTKDKGVFGPADAMALEIYELRAAIAQSAASQLDSERDAALKFADHIINGMFEGGNWDGGDVQELAVKYGLLKPETMQGPCNLDGACQCAQNSTEFPSTCYRKTYVAAMAAQQGGKGGA